MKTVIIIGAGPAGLTAGYELLKKSKEFKVIILEKESVVGGLSKSFEFNGTRIDIGGHRFFSKNDDINALWKEILPVSKNKMTICDRKSHIFYEGKMFEYPLNINKNLIYQMGIGNSLRILYDYMKAIIKPKEIQSLEDFYINKFGYKLYSMFFRDYTEKLWGIPANQLSADWGVQRVKGLNLLEVFHSLSSKKTEHTSLIEYFYYPSFGAGQFWEELAKKILEYGGCIYNDSEVIGIEGGNNHLNKIKYSCRGNNYEMEGDYIISSAPLIETISNMNFCPNRILEISRKLKYRDMIIIGMEIPVKYLGSILKEHSDDCWIYVQDFQLDFGRIQILNNWSPVVKKNSENYIIELECYCNEGDKIWNEKDEDIVWKVTQQLKKKQFIAFDFSVTTYLVKRIQKAYPVYVDGYYELEKIKNFIDDIDNLYCIGRNGQHRYNNMDHSMLTGILASDDIILNGRKRSKLWEVNSEQEYHELKKNN